MPETTIILYAKNNDTDAKRLQSVIALLVSGKGFKIRRSIEHLSRSLSHSLTHNVIVILLASSKEDLQALLAICDLLVDIQIILVLPDEEKETISKGHRLYPRFVSNITSDFRDVGAVLEKMLKTINESPLLKRQETIQRQRLSGTIKYV